MKLGVMMFPTDLAIRPDHLAREAEARGFESLFFPEHTHIPTSRLTPFPGGEPIPEHYKRSYDPFVALAMAAAATSELRLGTGICLVAQRDPIVLAKEVASLDFLSDGRFIFGIGYGWNVDEMEDHGVEAKRRWSLVREKVLAMKALWSDEPIAFEGDRVSVPASWAWPKPVQKPHPPILIGGRLSPAVRRHIIEFADGWMPIGGRGETADAIAGLRREAEEAGRDPNSLEISVFAPPPKPEVIEGYAAAGVARVILSVPSEPADSVLPRLDRHASLATLGA